jgi:hypothetical protein
MEMNSTDTVLPVRRGTPAAELILRRAGEMWPDFFVEDVNSGANYHRADSDLWLYGTASKNFYMFRNKSSMEDWGNSGRTDENAGDLLAVIIQPPRVTLSCGTITEDIQQFIDDIRTTFVHHRK